VLICLGSVIGRPGLIHCARRFYTLKQRISSYRSNLLPSNKIYYSLSQSCLLSLRHCNLFLVVGPHLNDDAVPIHCDILNKVSMLLYRTKGAPIHCWCPKGLFALLPCPNSPHLYVQNKACLVASLHYSNLTPPMQRYMGLNLVRWRPTETRFTTKHGSMDAGYRGWTHM